MGPGKSTALRAFAQSLDRNVYRVVYLSNPHLTVPSVYRQILVGLHTEPVFGLRRLLPQFHTIVTDLARKGRYVLLIVDEAHLLPTERFDRLRFLLNQKMSLSSSITLVLLGQPDLVHKLRFADRNQVLGSEQLTAALLDRLTHRSTVLEFVGESYRFRERMRREAEERNVH